jgi:hypothetical protein
MLYIRSLSLIFGVVIALWSPVGLSFGTTQCWTDGTGATGSLVRVEKEIWGANVVTWIYNGQAIDADSVSLDEKSIQVISKSELDIESLGRAMITQYTAKVTLLLADSYPQSVAVQCQSEFFPHLRD